MNWAVVIGALMFGAMVLLMIYPAVAHDPFAIFTAFMAGIFVGMLIESASNRCKN